MNVEKRGFLANATFESHSVFDSLRAATQLQIKAATVGMTRREASRTETPPTPEQIAEYERLQAMLDEVEASEFWEHSYDGGYLRRPEPTVEIEWAETLEEFEARVNDAYRQMLNGDFSRIIPDTFKRKESHD